MFAMSEQQLLFKLLHELRDSNLHDSRPSYKRKELENMINFVGSYLDHLQDKRHRILILFQKRKRELEAQYSKLKCLKELDEVRFLASCFSSFPSHRVSNCQDNRQHGKHNLGARFSDQLVGATLFAFLLRNK